MSAQPWVNEGDGTRCTRHDEIFPRSHVCKACLAEPPPAAVKVPDAEAIHVARVRAVAVELRNQSKEWRKVERERLRAASKPDATARDQADAMRSAAMAADVIRKALVAEVEIQKKLAQVAKVDAMRRERAAMRKGRH